MESGGEDYGAKSGDEYASESTKEYGSKIPDYKRKIKEKTAWKRKSFCKEWLFDPEFRDWVREYEGDKHKVICSVCQKVLLAGRSELQRHASGKKHQKNMGQKPRGLKEVLEELEIEDDDVPNISLESGEFYSRAASKQNFLMRWATQEDLLKGFNDLYSSQSFVDVTLACEGQTLKAHKVILSACSSYFRSLLEDSPTPHPIIFMRDVKFEELENILEFIYNGEVQVSQENLGGMLKTASALKIKGLSSLSCSVIDNSASDSEGVSGNQSSPQKSAAIIRKPPRKRRRSNACAPTKGQDRESEAPSRGSKHIKMEKKGSSEAHAESSKASEQSSNISTNEASEILSSLENHTFEVPGPTVVPVPASAVAVVCHSPNDEVMSKTTDRTHAAASSASYVVSETSSTRTSDIPAPIRKRTTQEEEFLYYELKPVHAPP